ncbi:MAG: hypothetical protein KDC85_11510 [Saprospiraceae bacterium]|nr:hypothetical protein [Saprospiraceae bacterium]MCB9281785.1 hypothetical protein [Lewinellaceae bacterium]
MEFWNKKVNVSKEAAQMQISIISKFSPEKRMKIALDFANMGIDQTRKWLREKYPNISDLELNLEFVRLIYYEGGTMSEELWRFYERIMEKKIKKDWASRFRKMMRENNWEYDDVAKLGDFKNGKVIAATISRGLPAFAKLAVVVHELKNKS